MTIEFDYRKHTFRMKLVKGAPITYSSGCLYVNLNDVISCIDLYKVYNLLTTGVLDMNTIKNYWGKHPNLLIIPTDYFNM